MKENKEFLLKSTMVFGVPMGIYWCFKYIFFILGYSYPIFIPVYEILTFFVIVIAYQMTKMYKRLLNDTIGFVHAWQFGILLYFFSSLILSVEQYIYFRYLAPNDFLSNLTTQATEILQQMNASTEMVESVKVLRLTPIVMTFQGIFNNTFYGIIFSLPIAVLVRTKNAAVKNNK